MDCLAVALISAFAALGVSLTALEITRFYRAKRASFTYIFFGNEPESPPVPDVILICRTEAEQDEIIKRICASDSRKAYIKRW